LPAVHGTKLALDFPSAVLSDLFGHDLVFLLLQERDLRTLTNPTKGGHMAEMQSTTRTAGTQSLQASTQQDGHDTAERNDHMQETAQEMRDKAQELMTQGKEVAAEYYEEGRNQILAWQQQLENQVREKPLQSILVAAGIGLLYGLLRRR
jgi:ElaB/YqjD/DUF883 family membrane-anchored ribosome-binding protein